MCIPNMYFSLLKQAWYSKSFLVLKLQDVNHTSPKMHTTIYNTPGIQKASWYAGYKLYLPVMHTSN